MKCLKLSISLFVAIGLSSLSFGQIRQNWRLFPGESESESVEKLSTERDSVGSADITYVEGIEELTNRYVNHNEKLETISGYRLEIFSASGSNSSAKAQSYRMNFLQAHDSIPAYVVWENPNFEVRVGDCRTKLEAEALRQFIKEDYPRAFIKKDEIQLPKLEE